MATLETRIEKLERQQGQTSVKRDFVIKFIRAPDGFCSGFLRMSTREQLTQGDTESDADFVLRAKAAGFERDEHDNA